MMKSNMVRGSLLLALFVIGCLFSGTATAQTYNGCGVRTDTFGDLPGTSEYYSYCECWAAIGPINRDLVPEPGVHVRIEEDDPDLMPCANYLIEKMGGLPDVSELGDERYSSVVLYKTYWGIIGGDPDLACVGSYFYGLAEKPDLPCDICDADPGPCYGKEKPESALNTDICGQFVDIDKDCVSDPDDNCLIESDLSLSCNPDQADENNNGIGDKCECVVSLEASLTDIAPGQTTTIEAKSFHEIDSIEWETTLSGTDLQIEEQVRERDNRKFLEIKAISGEGTITVKATIETPFGVECVTEELPIDVGCGPCSGNVPCDDPRLDSVDWKIRLGREANGNSAGMIWLRSKELTTALGSPQALEVYFNGGGYKVLDNGVLTQVNTKEKTINIDTIDEYSYTISRYLAGDRTTRDLNTRLWSIDAGAEPEVAWTVNADVAECEPGNNCLRITRLAEGLTSVYTYSHNAADNTWSLETGTGANIAKKLTRQKLTDADGNSVEIDTVQDGSGVVSSVKQTTFKEIDTNGTLREVTLEEILDPAGAALTTTSEYYEEPDCPAGSCGLIKQRIRPNGSWVRYTYDDQSRKITEARSWQDQPITAADDQVRIITYDYTPIAGSGDTGDNSDETRTITEAIQGIVTSKTYVVYQTDETAGTVTEIREQCIDLTAPYGDAGNLRSVAVTYLFASDMVTSAQAGKPKTVISPDGTQTTYTYTAGGYTPASDPSALGTFTAGSGDDVQIIKTEGTWSNPDGIANQTTRRVTITNDAGDVLEQRSEVYTGTVYETLTHSTMQYDDLNRLIHTYASNGLETSAVWSCCGKASEVDEQGISYTYTHDILGRMVSRTKHGSQDITTTYTYDASGRRLTETVTADTLQMSSSTQYDLTGRVTQRTDTGGLASTIAYAEGGGLQTVTYPGGATEITRTYQDGRTQSITGTRSAARYYHYGVESDGSQWTTVYTGTDNGSMWAKNIKDPAGREIRREQPGPEGTEIFENVYNHKGQIIKTIAPSTASTLYVHDDLGRVLRTGMDADGDDSLTLASDDRIQEHVRQYILIDEEWWAQAEQKTYPTSGDATAVTMAVQRQRLSGLGEGGLVSENVNTDINGLETVARIIVNRSAATRTVSVDLPDSDTDQQQVYQYGLLVSQTTKTGLTSTFNHDALERRTGITDPRKGTQTMHYNANHRVDWIEDAAGNRTRYTYDTATGRRLTETDALNQVRRFQHDLRGQVTHEWGDGALPVYYVYDDQGRMVEMHTYRTNPGFEGEAWPETTTGDVTRWQYDEATGNLNSKEYADGSLVQYTYGNGNRLSQRLWARLNGTDPMATAYQYDPVSGALTLVDYADDTTDINYIYNRMGQPVQINDAVGQRTLTYNAALQLENEQISGLYNRQLVSNYDAMGRPAGIQVTDRYNTEWGYDSTGHIGKVSWDAPDASYLPPYVLYYRLENSDRVGWMGYRDSFRRIYRYEDHRDLKTAVENRYGGTQTISRYGYTYDAVGNRSEATLQGQVFIEALNQKAVGSNWIDTLSPGTTEIENPSERHSYTYDPINNRTTDNSWDDPAQAMVQRTYVNNNLNQTTEVQKSATTNNLTYDADGNMTGLQTDTKDLVLTYNAENRLVSVMPGTVSEDSKQAAYVYDYMGRRVEKQVRTYTSGAWVLSEHRQFVYNGWNLIEEIDLLPATPESKYYVWGLDLSETFQGAGGIGGLIAIIEGAKMYYPCFDGNGNLTQLVDASTEEVVAHYEYDPYGNLVTSMGYMADENPIRFSTKYFDDETGLGYWGYRYYSPELGRWMNRDPIEEKGGMNLYGFVQNNPINSFDKLGLETDPYGDGMWPKDKPSGWAAAISDLWVWVKGAPPGTLYYPIGSERSQKAAASTIGKRLEKGMLAKFQGKKCSNWGSYTNVGLKFGITTYITDLPNGRAHFIGSASGDAFTSESNQPCKVKVLYTLTNTTSLTSLLYGLWPDSWNSPSGNVFGNWTQVYAWEKEYACRH